MGLGACGPNGVPSACSGEMRLHDAGPAACSGEVRLHDAVPAACSGEVRLYDAVPAACSGEVRLYDAVPAGSPWASGLGEIDTTQGTRTMAVIPDSGSVEGSIERAEEGHRARRRKAARIYGWIEGIFFVTLVVLAALVLARFAVRVLPEYFQ